MREQLLNTESHVSESTDAPDRRLSEMPPVEENAVGDFLFEGKFFKD